MSYWTLRRRALSTVRDWSLRGCEAEILDTNSDISQPLFQSHSSATDVYLSPDCDVGPSSECNGSCPFTQINEVEHSYNYDDQDGQFIHEYSDSEEDSTEDVESESLSLQLLEWAVKEKVTNTAVDQLQTILHPYHPQLPQTARTLLKTGQHSSEIKKIPGGEYVHFWNTEWSEVL